MNKYIIGFLIGIITACFLLNSIYYQDGVNAGIDYAVDVITTNEKMYNEVCGNQNNLGRYY